ncbi:tetratricopeptide repeat protein [Actinoplanes sp. CA-054009]
MTFADDVRGAFRRGQTDEVVRLCRSALAEARAIEVEALYGLSRVAIRSGDLPEAARLARQSLEAAQRAGERALEERPRHVLAAVARLSGDLSGARELYLDSIRLNEELGQAETVLTERHNLAFCDLRRGDLDAARALFAANRAEAERNGWTSFLPFAAIADACLAAAEGDHLRAARLIAVADAAFAARGQVPDPDDAAELDLARTQATTALGESAYAEAYTEAYAQAAAR